MNKGDFAAIAVVIGFSVLFALGCKDDDEYEYQYLDGTVMFTLDAFLAPNTSVSLEPRGVSHPEGGSLTYVWTVTSAGGAEYKDTTYSAYTSFNYTFCDTLQSYDVNCTASADDYISSSTTLTTQIVLGGLDGNGSITDADGNAIVNLAQLGKLTDERDGAIYYYTGFNGYDWLIQNLIYRGSGNSVGIAYMDYDVTNDVFGTYYSYNEAVEACPEGWKLPSSDEWDECITFDSGSLMGNVYFNGSKMWEYWPAVTISNTSFFTAIPVGDANLAAKSFDGFGDRAVFWTSTEYDADSSKGIVKYLIDEQNITYEAVVDKASYGANVRCIRLGKSGIPF